MNRMIKVNYKDIFTHGLFMSGSGSGVLTRGSYSKVLWCYSFMKTLLRYQRDELGVMRAADWKWIKAQLGFYR